MADDFTTDSDQIYQQYANQPSTFVPTEGIPGAVSVTTINGVTGPAVNFDGSAIGFSFSPAGTDIIFSVSNAATARGALGAAKSGANADITSFTGLTGNTGFVAWTGTADGSTHATYPATTASVGYVAAELQGVMDKLKQATELIKKLLDANLAAGIIEA